MRSAHRPDLQSDFAKLREDYRHLAEDFEEEVEHVAEDAIGAQFASATDLAETIGTELEFGMRVQEIWWEQVAHGLQDISQVVEELYRARSPETTINAITGHISRRIDHAGKGILDLQQALVDEQLKLIDIHRYIWDAFARSL